MNDKLLEVYNHFNENQLWNDIYLQDGSDEYGEYHLIFESWDDVGKFTKEVKSFLKLDDDTSDYDLEKLLETNFVFSDEYTICDDCNAVIRTSPDSYHWQPNFYIGDGFIVCEKCFNSESDYQEAYILEKINNPKTAINGLISENQLEELGFSKYNNDSYENGWYNGQADDPQTIYNSLENDYNEIVFLIDGVGQFDVHFSVWVRGEV